MRAVTGHTDWWPFAGRCFLPVLQQPSTLLQLSREHMWGAHGCLLPPCRLNAAISRTKCLYLLLYFSPRSYYDIPYIDITLLRHWPLYFSSSFFNIFFFLYHGSACVSRGTCVPVCYIIWSCCHIDRCCFWCALRRRSPLLAPCHILLHFLCRLRYALLLLMRFDVIAVLLFLFIHYFIFFEITSIFAISFSVIDAIRLI